jgi:hypothetical protein
MRKALFLLNRLMEQDGSIGITEAVVSVLLETVQRFDDDEDVVLRVRYFSA